MADTVERRVKSFGSYNFVPMVFVRPHPMEIPEDTDDITLGFYQANWFGLVPWWIRFSQEVLCMGRWYEEEVPASMNVMLTIPKEQYYDTLAEALELLED